MFLAGLAQLVEQRTCNAKVEGSTPLAGTRTLAVFRIKRLPDLVAFFLLLH